MQIKDPRTTNGYKDPPPRRRYQVLRAIHCRKQAAYISNLKTKTVLFQYQGTVTIPNTYTIADSDLFRDTPNLQSDWIPPCVDELNLLERLTYTLFTALHPFWTPLMFSTTTNLSFPLQVKQHSSTHAIIG